MSRLIYSLLFYLLIPAVVLRLLWRSIKEPSYRASLPERFGFVNFNLVPESDQPIIWVHAVSAGETIAAIPLIKKLLESDFKILVTTMTPAGRERVRTILGPSVLHCYAPYDLPDAISRFLGKVRPRALIIIDTELWPNIIHQCCERKIKTFLVNGRMSARSAAGYKRVLRLTKVMLNELDLVAAQTHSHGERFVDLGLAQGKLVVAGSIKFDQKLPPDFADRTNGLKIKLGERFIVIGASTHQGEEAMILKACAELRKTRDDLLLVLAPRHLHRCDEVKRLAEESGEKIILHSTGNQCEMDTTVFLLDTMGELTYFYGVADIAIVGGSLVPVGGHNLMEAVAASVPVIMGPHLENIDDIAAMFREAGGLRIVNDAQHLEEELSSLVNSDVKRQELTESATRVLNANKGALEKVQKIILGKIR